MTEPRQHRDAGVVRDLTGTTVGRFAIRAKLGEGGMGEVYRADDTRLKRPVALKRMSPFLRGDDYYRRRFLKEAERASHLTDDHIAGVYDVFEDGAEVFIVMEYVEGETLRQRLKQPHTLEEFLPIALQCAASLVAAHSRGIAHRDLKPENIMLTRPGKVKILDFGVAKLLPHARDLAATESLESVPGAFSGTVAYAAPEVLLEEESDERADIFSLGVVFYEMLAGKHPFRVAGFAATTDRILHATPESLRALNSSVTPELESIINRMLAKSPAERYATANELLDDLRRLERQQRVPAAEPSPPRPAPMPTPRPRRWGRLAAGAAVVLVLGILLAANMNRVREWMFGPAPPPRIHSIAVLPLENISGDPSQEYFADGMTEALITELGRVSSLRVISRTSVMRYKNARKSPREIAAELNVDSVVEGSAQKAGPVARVSVRVVEARTETLLWSQAYERDLSNVLALQSDLAWAIAQELQVALTPRERQLLAHDRPVNPEAHDAYLRGRYFWNQRTDEGFAKAIEHFQKATEIDPNYALPYAGLADVYLQGSSMEEDRKRAREAALKAIELDPASAEAHTSLAGVHFWGWNWEEAEKEFRRALELNPSYATAHSWYSRHLSALGRMEEALGEIERARELDPLSLVVNRAVGWTYYHARQYGRAVRQYREVKDMAPNLFAAYSGLGDAYLQKGMGAEAVSEFEVADRLKENNPESLGKLGHAYAVTGKRAEARRVLERLKRLDAATRRRSGASFHIALVHAGLGEKKEAFRWLDTAYEEQAWPLCFAAVDPALDPLRDDPRFQALLRRLGLPALSPPASSPTEP